MTDVRSDIHRHAHMAVFGKSVYARQRAVKALLVACWDLMPARERHAFLSRVDQAPDHEFIRFEPRWPELADNELEEAARNWWYVIALLKQGGASEELGFAKSIRKLLRLRRKPSEKQARWMKEIWRDHKRWRDTETEVVE